MKDETILANAGKALHGLRVHDATNVVSWEHHKPCFPLPCMVRTTGVSKEPNSLVDQERMVARTRRNQRSGRIRNLLGEPYLLFIQHRTRRGRDGCNFLVIEIGAWAKRNGAWYLQNWQR